MTDAILNKSTIFVSDVKKTGKITVILIMSRQTNI
jgi:hypothetical protein